MKSRIKREFDEFHREKLGFVFIISPDITSYGSLYRLNGNVWLPG